MANEYKPNDYIFVICRKSCYIKQLRVSGPIVSPMHIRMSTAYQIICSGIPLFQYDPLTKKYAQMTVQNAFDKNKFASTDNTATTSVAQAAAAVASVGKAAAVGPGVPATETVDKPATVPTNVDVVKTIPEYNVNNTEPIATVEDTADSEKVAEDTPSEMSVVSETAVEESASEEAPVASANTTNNTPNNNKYNKKKK